MAKYYKHPQYGHVYGESIPTPVGRFVWSNLVTPKDAPPPQKEGEKQGPPRYEITLLLEKTNAQVIQFMSQVKAMTDEMLLIFNKNRAADLGQCKIFGKAGDGDEFDHEKYPYYKGCYVLVARNQKPTKAVNADKPKPKVIEASGILGGMTGKLVVTPMITAHGISYKLEVTQLIKDDGTRYGGAARDAVELLEACEDESEDEAPAEVTNGNGTPEPAPAKVAKKGKAAALDLL